MPVFARRDIQRVAVSPDHGGCGQVHERPGGADLWEVAGCSCEDFLRHDPLWSATISEIPETPDEFVTREDWAKRGAADQQYVMAMALARMANVEIPESLTRVLTGRTKALSGITRCPQGHDVQPGKQFCGDCGSSMTAEMVRCRDGHANDPGEKFCGDCGVPMGSLVPGSVVPDSPQIAAPKRRPALKDLKADDLRGRCRAMGLSDAGTRPEMIARIRAAK